MVDELSERQRTILRLIIEHYVATARPVASEALAANTDLGVSPATIRNAMADLERGGYIVQPHTSAGRIPSDKGYRYVVEYLMGTATLPQSEQRTIDHQFHQVELDIEEWMHLSASLLSRLVRNAAVVTPPHSSMPRVKHLQLLGLSERRAMLLLVGQDSTLMQQLLTFDEDWDQEHLSALATLANSHFYNKTASELGALDLILDVLLNETYVDKPYFDFGISTEDGGRTLNVGLVENKESYGARAVAYDFYELDLRN